MAPNDQIAWYRKAMGTLNKQPCQCVHCDWCHGTGNIRVSYDAPGRMSEGFGDDMDDLEPCDQCHGGITEVCDRCREMEELDQQREEIEERRAAGGPGGAR